MGLFDFLKPKVDTSNFVTIDQYNELKGQLRQIIEFIPDHVDTSNFALKSEIPSVEGLATIKQIPSIPDMKLYVLWSELPDTVKYIENSNATSKIKKISISIEDKATFDPKKNPTDNIAHTI